MAHRTTAAGLLLLLLSAQLCVAGPLSSDLVDTFKTRGVAKQYYHRTLPDISRPSHPPHRGRKRQSQIRLAVHKEATNVTVITSPQAPPPPHRFQLEKATSLDRYGDGLNKTSLPPDVLPEPVPSNTTALQPAFEHTSTISEISKPVEVFDDGTLHAHSGRKGKTINPLIIADMETDNVDDDVMDMMYAMAEQQLLAILPLPSVPQGPAFSMNNGGLDIAPTLPEEDDLPLAKRDSSDNGLTAAPTWRGQPSVYRPRVPYEPSRHKAQDYGDVISKSLWFYQVQRSGLLLKGPRGIKWRNDSALRDGFDNNVDLTGGYYDAGDYLKFMFPLSSAMTLLAWSGTDHWRGFMRSENIGYLDETLRWGFDWMIKAHPTSDVLYVQVGDGKVDNDYWGGDKTIPTPRPSFWVDRGQPGTDVAAGAAGAFAAGAIFYSAIIGDQDYAKVLLKHALSLFYFAESTPKAVYQKSVPAVQEWYASSDYSDELVLAALQLYRATSNAYFLQRAELYFNKYKLYESRDPVDWDSKHGLCFLLGAQLVQQNGVQSKVDWLGTLTTYLKEGALKQGTTPGGLLYYQGSSNENSLPTALGITYVMTEYSRLFPSQDIAKKVRKLADSQIDYVFGKNPNNMTYVVGVTDRSPKNPQSAMASGGEDSGNIDHSPEEMARVLYGGLVGGPAKDDSFQDKRSNYKQSECALDYNAPFTAILAGELELGKLPYFARQSGSTSEEAA